MKTIERKKRENEVIKRSTELFITQIKLHNWHYEMEDALNASLKEIDLGELSKLEYDSIATRCKEKAIPLLRNITMQSGEREADV